MLEIGQTKKSGLSLSSLTHQLASRFENVRPRQNKHVALGSGLHPSSNGGAECFSFNAEYLRQLKEANARFVTHFCEYFRPRLRTMLTVHRIQEADKQDIIQETIVRVLTAVKRDQIRIPEAFGAYVVRVCRNVLYGSFRPPEISLEEIELPADKESPEMRQLRLEREKYARIVLRGLRAKDRNLLRERVFGDLSPAEMRAKFGARSQAHFRVMFHRACKRFKQMYNEHGLT